MDGMDRMDEGALRVRGVVGHVGFRDVDGFAVALPRASLRISMAPALTELHAKRVQGLAREEPEYHVWEGEQDAEEYAFWLVSRETFARLWEELTGEVFEEERSGE